ncbi:hypothetical protein ACXR0O_25915 [Verrucomicrobiota bacterium sgz303538]
MTDLHASAGQGIQRGELEAAIEGICEMADEGPKDSRSSKRLFELALRIPAKEFARVLDQLRRPGSKRHDQLRAELLGYWMELNAPAARAYLAALPVLERARLIGPAADTWARMDSEGLMSWLRNLPSHDRQAVRDTVRNSVALALSERDPAMAVSLLMESPDGENGGDSQVEFNIFFSWADKNPEEAAQRALLLSGGKGRSRALVSVMEQWKKTDPAAAMAWVRNISDPNLAREAGIALAARLGLIDSETAVKFAVEQGVADDVENYYLRNACNGWMKRDPAGALAWAQSQPSSPSRDATLARMLANVAKTQPETAIQIFVTETERGANMAEASQGIIMALGKAGDGKVLASFFEHVLESERPYLTENAASRLVNEVEPAQILSVGLQLPPGPLREGWLERSVYWITMQKGLQQTRQVLETLPAGPERNSLAARAVLDEFNWNRNIEGAVALAQTLPEGRDYIKQGVERWLRSADATGARNWLSQTRVLTEEDKQQLLQSVAVAATTAPQPATGARPAPNSSIPRP